MVFGGDFGCLPGTILFNLNYLKKGGIFMEENNGLGHEYTDKDNLNSGENNSTEMNTDEGNSNPANNDENSSNEMNANEGSPNEVNTTENSSTEMSSDEDSSNMPDSDTDNSEEEMEEVEVCATCSKSDEECNCPCAKCGKSAEECQCPCSDCGKVECECECSDEVEEIAEHADDKVDALVSLLVKKGIITEAELQSEYDDLFEEDKEEKEHPGEPIAN